MSNNFFINFYLNSYYSYFDIIVCTVIYQTNELTKNINDFDIIEIQKDFMHG